MSRLGLLSSLAFGSCVAMGLSREARADVVSGYAINRFEPSDRGSQWFTLESLDYSGKLRPAIGVIGDYGWRQLRLHDVTNDTKYVVSSQLAFHVGASLFFAERFKLGLSLPIYAYQAGTDLDRYDGSYKAASGGGLGDLRVSADARLLGDKKDAFRLGLGARVWVPTGDAAKYTGDGEIRVQPHLDAAGDVGPLAYAVTAGFLYRKLHETFGPTPIGNEIPFGAALGMKFADDKALVGPELQGSIAVSDTGTVYSKNVFPLYGLLMGRVTAGDWRLGAAAGPGLSHASGTTAFKGLLAIEWVPAESAPPPPSDRDKDGILDTDDACPDVAGVKSDDPKKNGCPADRDKDGIVDKDDACPDVAGVKSDDPKKNGCPPDRDGDGVVDAEDACPDVAGPRSADPKKNGCPGDKDGDGIVDGVDACPDVAGVSSDDPKKNGCPGDTDKDGIVDPEDACPKDPGPKNPDPKKNGCPSVIVSGGQIKIFEQVKFKTGSAEILQESDGILDAVGKTLKDHAEIAKVRVEGHTDNAGKPAMNKALSQRRAESVVAALVKRGIDKKRLAPEGFGQEHPIDGNDSDAGRQNNRRVEFHIVEAPKK